MAQLVTTAAPARLLHPRENLFVTGNLSALNSEIQVDADGAGSFALDLRGTFSVGVEVQGTVNGTDWTLIPMRPLNVASTLYVSRVTGTAPGIWVGSVGPYRKLRAINAAYTSGTAVATLVVNTAPLDQSLLGMVAPSIGTAVGASGAAVTLTLASPGAGLRHYITYVSINRIAAALLTAGAAPVTVTTTNLPGSLAFSLPADAAAQGTSFPLREDFAYPIAAAAQATATTIVAPATTNVIWRVTAGFYVAP
jgi:hypothetical protein